MLPQGFFFGASTSAHQVEGNTHNDWSEWEQKNAARLARIAPDLYKHLPQWERIKGRTQDPANYISSRGADHYHRYEEDFDIAKTLGHNAHRFSIEWSRIEPEEGKFNEQELEHYRQVIQALHARNLEPFICLWHWTLPTWLRDKGGVKCSNFPDYFERYARFVVERLKGDVRYWLTINEPTSVIGHAYLLGRWPPQKKSFLAALKVYKVLARAHRQAYGAIHEIQPAAQVGFANIMTYVEPYRNNFLDRLACRLRDYWANAYFLKLTGAATHDYLALQYYFHWRLAFPQTNKNENKEVNDMGWEIYQEGLYHLLKKLAPYNKPIFITENGLADAQDMHRTKFIEDALFWIKKAGSEGVDVRGYFHWSLLDNFEWADGYWPRFGLVEVDYATLERRVRPSAMAYKAMIEKERR